VAHKKQLKQEYDDRLAAANQHDGHVHRADGKKVFVDNGAEIGGVNLNAQVKGKHGHKHAKKHHKNNQQLVQKPNDKKAASSAGSEVEEQKKKNAAFEAKMEAEKQESVEKGRMEKANQFDGLVHGADGKARFVDSGLEVNGVNNNLAQVHHKHAASHGHQAHKKAHATHKKEHHVTLAQHGHKTAAKRHGAKKHAHARPHHEKVHDSEMD